MTAGARPQLPWPAEAAGENSGAGHFGGSVIAFFQAKIPAIRRRVGVLTFVAIVVVPTLVGAFYFAFIASDQYVAESKLAVREASPIAMLPPGLPGGTSGTALLANLARAGGPSLAGKNSYVVVAYLRSRNFVQSLDEGGRLRAVFSSAQADTLSRFDPHLSAEALWRYWQDMVGVTIDSMSGIVTIRAKAFTPQDAAWLCNEMTRRAEAMVNAFTSRGRRDALAKAEAAQGRARERFIAATTALREFRDSRGTVDPVEAATADTIALFSTMKERSSRVADRAATNTIAADAPGLNVLDAQLRALDEQIAKLQKTLTSPDPSQRAASAAFSDYERLERERLFSEKFYTIATNAVDKAQDDLANQRDYLATFVPAAVPQLPAMPRRALNTLAIFAMAVVIWGFVRLMIALIVV